MSTKMRAKLYVRNINPNEIGSDGKNISETIDFGGVPKSDSYPQDGSDEDNTFAKFSPSVNLQILIANPNLVGKFTIGEKYYVDFTPVE